MNGKQREIYAAYGGVGVDDLARIMGDDKLNPFTQAELLAAALAMPFKETGRAHYRSLIQEQQGYPKQIAEGLNWMSRLRLEQSLLDELATLPWYSFILELQFVLAKPYLSEDDDAFYIIDNPVRKDKVFKVPYVAPTSWKGSLRAAATRGLLRAFVGHLPTTPPQGEADRAALLQTLWAERARQVVLFGNEKENQAKFLNRWLASRLLLEQSGETEQERRKRVEEEARRVGEDFEEYLIEHCYRTEKIEGRQGRLFCFPTFFNRIGLEIINPHDRERRVGKNPTLFESVPAGAAGTFRLLYVPYDFPGDVVPDNAALQKQIRDELPLVAEAVRDLLTVYGFGAKTSSGFGVAEPVARQVVLGLNILVEQEVREEAKNRQEIAAAERAFVERFGLAEFPRLSDEELARSGWGRKRQSKYKRLRDRHPDWDTETRTWREPAPPPTPRRRPLIIDKSSLEIDELPNAVRELLARVRGTA